MDGRELQADNKPLETFPKFPVWIIEHVWAHKIMDIQEVVGSSYWPEVDSQPLSLEDSWRLRVSSAQVFSIVKNRDMEHFEKVMGFLEATYRLLPRLVAPIKHMKIMFGLKTMVIMWMLKEGRGMVDTVYKIIQFFPSKLPQYHDHCSKRDMFLMRKNQMDFKSLTQALAMDKDKREDYMKKHVEEQYGEHYAQKVEDRLLHYLHKLETVLPGDTYIDKILKKSCPVTEEEKLLLEVITCDASTIATTLKKLLHCDSVSCGPASECGENEVENSQMSRSVLHDRSSTPEEIHPEVFRAPEEAAEVSTHSPLLFENDNGSHVGRHPQTREHSNVVERVEEERSDKGKEEAGQRSREATCSPHFCSKHRRWVKSILQECPDECSEELLLQATVSSSPILFQSSSSTSSSQDLTPSNLVPCLPDEQSSANTRTPAGASEQANPEDKRSSGSASNTPQTEPLPLPSASRDSLPALWSPVVRLVDIASVRLSCPTIKHHHSTKSAASTYFTSSGQMLILPLCHTSGIKEFPFSQPEGVDPSNSAYELQTAPTFTICQPAQRLSLPNFTVAGSYRYGTSTSINQTGPANTIPPSAKSSTLVVHQSPIECHLQTNDTSPLQSNIQSCSTRPSPPSRAVFPQRTLLQPRVSLTRLSALECHRTTSGRCWSWCVEPVLQRRNEEEEEDADSSFDPNTLYSSHSSGSDSDDSADYDPDFKPCINKKRLFPEYEYARSLNHT